MRRTLVVGLWLIIVSTVATIAHSQHAVQHQYKFKHLTVDQGLSNNNIRSICQDSKGYIWIATGNGTSKFDGHTIVIYRNDPNDTTTIPSNAITSIFLDSKNNLWFCCEKGLFLYSNDSDEFNRFLYKSIDGQLGNVEAVVEDNDGKLWIAAERGLVSYNQSTSEIQFFSNEKVNIYGIPSKQIYRLIVDKSNNIWFSAYDSGLSVYYQHDKVFRHFRNDPKDPSTIGGDRIKCVYEDSKGNIWAGTYDSGLNRFVPENSSFIRIIPDPNNSYSTRVRVIFEDLKGDFFIGTRIGLYILNRQTNEFVHYAYEGHNFSSLSQNSITRSFIDNSGTLWIGTHSGGVNYTNLRRKEFVHYKAGKNDNRFLQGTNIYAITEDPEGNLWVGGDNGLNYLDRTSHTFTYYSTITDNSNSLSYNDIKALEWDKKNNLWIGTNNGGLNYLNIKKQKFRSYIHDPENDNSISGDKIYGLLNDKNNALWILTNDGDLFGNLHIDILPDGSDKFIHLAEKAYFGIDEDENGDVYIGGLSGFWIFSRKDSVFNFISNDTFIEKVNTIKRDSEGKIWVGSIKGLVRYNTVDKSFSWYSEANGYPISEVFGILEDDSKNLWVSTNNGLVKITNIVRDTVNIKFRVFNSEDGLQSQQFNYNAFYKSKSGEMAFGGINGFNTFFPDKIDENPIPPNVILTDLKIFNTSVPINKKFGDRIILKKSIGASEQITLGPKQNVFTLEFAALHYANPGKNIFKFKLEGFDEEWHLRKANNNFVTYTNLPANEYTFIITASNNDGIWNEEPVALNITIVPPFWKTWWFRIVVSLILIALGIGFYYYRARSIRYKNQVLEDTVKKRTQEIYEKNEEIVAQKEELELHRNKLESLVKERTMKLEDALAKSKESDELKSAFLANMSHEIRTPLNAIVGFSDLLREENLPTEDRDEFSEIIQSNSDSLVKIIDEILDLSLIESNQLKLTKETFDFNVLIDNLYSYYSLSNKNPNREIRKKNVLENLNLKFHIDKTRLQQVITNLMDNACKFTEKGYVELGIYKDNDLLCIYVEDTGKGIPSSEIGKIFQQFIKIEDNDSEWKHGLGLGLAISQKIANQLGGSILVKSEKGKGSIFTFRIPFDMVVTNEQIIVKEIKNPLIAKWHDKTILIAEDIEANYIFLKSILKKTQVNIIWAKNGEEVLKIAIENPTINLILMDIKMPKLNGHEAAKKIKEHNPDQIIIAQTAYARPQEKLKFYDENFDEYISKPINPADLLLILEQFL